MKPINDHESVTVVTVTYGRRWCFLQEVLESLLAEQPAVREIVVVNNNAQDDIAAAVLSLRNDRVRVVHLSENTGSAMGYGVGIEAAIKETESGYILLLDDDNVLEPGALAVLMKAHAEVANEIPIDRLAVLGFRPEHQADLAAGLPVERAEHHPNSFFGFHVVDIPFKLLRRMPWVMRRYGTRPLPQRVRVRTGPYSGLLFHRAVVERVGTPNPDLVLYADDTEFTYRLTAIGGGIWLIPGARLADLESSWNAKTRFATSFTGWLCGEGDQRAYYGARNQAYFEGHCRDHNPLVRGLNQAVYLALLALMAVRLRRMARLRLLLNAIRDGSAGHLGLHPGFPLG